MNTVSMVIVLAGMSFSYNNYHDYHDTKFDRAAEGPWQWQTRVLLRSEEGDRYEIDQDILGKGSVFFKDLFAVPRPATEAGTASDDHLTPTDVDHSVKAKSDVTQLSKDLAQSLTLEEEIDIDASTADMILFADLLQFTVRFSRFGLPNHLQVTLEQAGILLSLADMYDCPAMRDILRQTVAQQSTHMPWQVLALACNQDDVNLARTAISNLSAKFIHDATQSGVQTTLWDNLSNLSPIWQLEFLRLYMPSTRRFEVDRPYNPGQTGKHNASPLHVIAGQLDGNFATWATLFDPKRYEG